MVDHATLRILDASFNRAGEGLRVAEDYARFVLDDPLLTRELKSMRHDLGAFSRRLPSIERHAARDTQRDVGTVISTEDERRRETPWDVCAGSLKRTEQALRSLEEYGKLVDAEFAGRMESLRYRLYTLEKAIDVGRSSRDRLADVRLCVLVDGCDSAAEFETLVGELVEASVGMIQLRDKRLNDRELVARARSLVSLTRRQPPALPGVINVSNRELEKPSDHPSQFRALAIINDRPDIAAAVHADGVHLGQEDLPVKDARAVVGARMLVGMSTHNVEQARGAVLDGADYLGAGPTFQSQTKDFDHFAGLDYLRDLAAEVGLPTFAIGGISAENLPAVLATGIERVAIGAAITASRKPASVARAMLDMLKAPTKIAATAAAAPSGHRP